LFFLVYSYCFLSLWPFRLCSCSFCLDQWSPSHFPSGHKILNGQKKIEFEKGQITEVKMSVQYMSFSAHADAKGERDPKCQMW
jgi:hypothetical protein